MPFVLTSSTYKEKSLLKIEEKKNKEKEKESRKMARELKKQEKEDNKNNKQNKTKTNRVKKTSIKKKILTENIHTNSNNKIGKTLKEEEAAKKIKVISCINIPAIVENEAINNDNVENCKRNLFFSSEKLKKGICYICTYNISAINTGIKCVSCIRSYHLNCLKKYNWVFNLDLEFKI